MLRLSWMNAVIAASVLASVIALGGCGAFTPSYLKPLSPQTRALLAEKGMQEQSPILIRIFKAESELEVWKAKDDGRFYHFKTYPICDYSGGLGPKVNQGDRQAPEGFYLVSEEQMNPKSKYHLAFNMGFPNTYDRAYGRTGADIMVHGDCKSAGCYAMTDGVIEEIYILAREALAGGQPAFQTPGLSVPHDGGQHGQAHGRPVVRLLAEPERGLRLFPGHPSAAQGRCVRAALSDQCLLRRRARQPDPVDDLSRLSAHRAVQVLPRGPVLQQASTKPGTWQSEVKPGRSADAGSATQQASLTPPLGSLLGLTFGRTKPRYEAFTLGPATSASSSRKEEIANSQYLASGCSFRPSWPS